MKLNKINSLPSILLLSLMTLLLTSLISCTPKKTEPYDEPTTKPKDTLNTEPTITTYFDATTVVSGTLTNYSMQVHMSFDTEHVNMPGGRFLVIDNNGTLTACVNPCSSNYWLQWDPNDTYVDWTMSGLLPKVGALEGGANGSLREIFSYQGDISGLVGVKVYVGYGLGATSAEAVNEMLTAKRYKLIHTIQ